METTTPSKNDLPSFIASGFILQAAWWRCLPAAATVPSLRAQPMLRPQESLPVHLLIFENCKSDTIFRFRAFFNQPTSGAITEMDWDEDDWEDPLHRAYIQVVDNEGAPAFSFHLPPGLPPLVDDGGAAADQMAIEEGLEPLTCAEVESTLRQRFRALPDARKMALPRSFLNQLFPRPSGEQEKETPEEKPGEEEEEEEKSQRYARAPPPPVSKRWLVGALRWLFLASQDDPQAGLAWLSTTATQPGERHEGGDVERTEEWCLMASAVLGHIESSMHDLYASPKLTNEYIARHTDLLADTEQLASWIKRACQAQRAEVLPYLLRCLSALGCAHARRVPQGLVLLFLSFFLWVSTSHRCAVDVMQVKTGMCSWCWNASKHRCSPPTSPPSSQVSPHSLSLSLPLPLISPCSVANC
jgi:hypothetical protein